jgi:hypothetical protein
MEMGTSNSAIAVAYYVDDIIQPMIPSLATLNPGQAQQFTIVGTNTI